MVRAWPLVLVAVSVAHASPATDALLSRDAAQIRAAFAGSVTNGGLWFADPACRAAFARPGELTGSSLDAFATCLAALPLDPSERREPFDDRIAFAYGPGFEIEARFADDKLSSIGFLGDGAPTITASALEQLRISGEPELRGGAYAWVELCLDDLGRVIRHDVREASSPAIARRTDAAVATWDFAPFRVDGRPVAVCALEELHAPSHEETALPIASLGGPDVVIGGDFARIAGERYIVPDDPDKVQMFRNGWSRVDPAVEICIDHDGDVESVRLVHSSGLDSYDNRILQVVHAEWRYRPYRDNGAAVRACTVVHFVYRQK